MTEKERGEGGKVVARIPAGAEGYCSTKLMCDVTIYVELESGEFDAERFGESNHESSC